jgi:cobalt-zinc-cadmium efflux system outer membrane protein
VALARTVGRTAAQGTSTAGELPAEAATIDEEESSLDARAGQLPMVRTAEARGRTAAARLAEVETGRHGQLQLGAALTVDAGGRGGLASFSAPIPVIDPAARERAGLSADVALKEGEAAKARVEAAALLRLARHEVVHTRELVESLAHGLVPSLEARVAARETLLKGGEGGLPELLRARRERLAALARLDEARARHAAAAWHWRHLVAATTSGER